MSPEAKAHVWEAIERLKRAVCSSNDLDSLMEMKEASSRMMFAAEIINRTPVEYDTRQGEGVLQ